MTEAAKFVVTPPVRAADSGGASPAGESVASPTRRRDVTWEDPLVGAALARDLSGLDYLLGIAEGRIPPPPIAALLGMSIVRVEPGQVTFGLDVGEHLYNPIGSVHGGVFCTLLDSAMGCAVHSSLDRGQAYTTLELKVNIVKALMLNTPSVAATGQVISGGRRVVTASGQITGTDGSLYAHATTTCLVFEPRPVQEKGPSGRSGENGDRLPRAGWGSRRSPSARAAPSSSGGWTSPTDQAGSSPTARSACRTSRAVETVSVSRRGQVDGTQRADVTAVASGTALSGRSHRGAGRAGCPGRASWSPGC